MEPLIFLSVGALVGALVGAARTQRAIRHDRQEMAVAAAKDFAEARARTLPSAMPWDELEESERRRLIARLGGDA